MALDEGNNLRINKDQADQLWTSLEAAVAEEEALVWTLSG